MLVSGLKPSTVYWYRFTDPQGNGSRVGRTNTAPTAQDDRPVRFAFVSCQNANDGAQNAYRRMIFEDEHAAERDRLGFVLHLGDFIYELVWYPEDRPQGMYDRRLRDIVRYAHGEKVSDFHIPTNVDDYRAIYRAYLHDIDLQDARAVAVCEHVGQSRIQLEGLAGTAEVRRFDTLRADTQSRSQPGVL